MRRRHNWMRHSVPLVIVAVMLLLLWAGDAAAMYTPNPAGRWAPQRFFLAGDFQFNRKDLDIDNGGTERIHDIVGMFARPSYSIARNLVVYGRVGFQSANEIDTGFAGGFGVQGAYVLPEAPEWAFGGSLDYLYWSADFSGSGRNIDWNEFQLAPAVSYHIPAIPSLTPYVGLLADFVDARSSLSESDPFGLLFGTNFDPSPHIRLDGQLRVATETGVLLSIGYLF
jgi:hypothetical protein